MPSVQRWTQPKHPECELKSDNVINMRPQAEPVELSEQPSQDTTAKTRARRQSKTDTVMHECATARAKASTDGNLCASLQALTRRLPLGFTFLIANLGHHLHPKMGLHL